MSQAKHSHSKNVALPKGALLIKLFSAFCVMSSVGAPAVPGKGLKVESNEAVLHSDLLLGELGKLTPVALGGLTISEKNAKGDFINRMQLDGVFLNGKVVVINEANWAPSEDRVKDVVSRRGFFRSLLTDMIQDRENFITEPADARDVLANAKITDIRVVISGHNVQPPVEQLCRAEGFYVCKQSTVWGAGYSVA